MARLRWLLAVCLLAGTISCSAAGSHCSGNESCPADIPPLPVVTVSVNGKSLGANGSARVARGSLVTVRVTVTPQPGTAVSGLYFGVNPSGTMTSDDTPPKAPYVLLAQHLDAIGSSTVLSGTWTAKPLSGQGFLYFETDYLIAKTGAIPGGTEAIHGSIVVS